MALYPLGDRSNDRAPSERLGKERAFAFIVKSTFPLFFRKKEEKRNFATSEEEIWDLRKIPGPFSEMARG